MTEPVQTHEPAIYSINTSVMRLQGRKTHDAHTNLTQHSLQNNLAVAESSFDDILDVGAPCPQNPNEIDETSMHDESVHFHCD